MKEKEITLAQSIEIAKKWTAEAKAVKAWRLRKADKNLQQLDIPKGYIIATGYEVREILIKAGKDPVMEGNDIKYVWALLVNTVSYHGRVTLDLAPIKSLHYTKRT